MNSVPLCSFAPILDCKKGWGRESGRALSVSFILVVVLLSRSLMPSFDVEPHEWATELQVHPPYILVACKERLYNLHSSTGQSNSNSRPWKAAKIS